MKFNEKLYNLPFKYKFLILIFLFILFTITLAFSYSNAVFNDIQDNIFRLHVIANSDSNEDQNLKYLIRDNVISYINEISENAISKDEVILLAQNNINTIKDIAQKTVYENGYNYPINVNIGNFEFPTKTYGDISFPHGFYDALKIEIGDACGQNWWCVMFPPLCFIDVTSGIVPNESKELMQDKISSEGYTLISEDDAETQIKFKIVELFQNLNTKFSKI